METIGDKLNSQIAVVVPVLNSQKTIKKCIDRLLAQTYIPDQIIFVDGESTDGTAEILNSYLDKGITVISCKTTIGEAQNLGILYALNYPTDYIAFTSADCYVPKTWLYELIKEFEHNKHLNIGGVTGKVITAHDVNFFGKTVGYLEDLRYPQQSQLVKSSATMNVLWKRDVIEKVKFPDMKSSENGMFAYAVRKKGYSILYTNRVIVEHHHRTSLKSWIKQQIRNARSELKLMRTFPERSRGDNIVSKRQLMQPFSLAGIVLSTPLLWWSKIPFIFCISWYIAINSSLTISAIKNSKKLLALCTFPILMIRPIFYDIGISLGIKDWIKEKKGGNLNEIL